MHGALGNGFLLSLTEGRFYMEVLLYVLGSFLCLLAGILLFLSFKADEKARQKRDLFYSEAYEYFKRENKLNRKD